MATDNEPSAQPGNALQSTGTPPRETTLDEFAALLSPLKHKLGWRLLLFFTGVALPLVCFVIGFPEQPRWQSGETSDFGRLMLSQKGLLPLYPFLFWSMISLTLLLISPARFWRSALVRLGVFGGVILGIEYLVLFHVALGGVEGLIGVPLAIFTVLVPLGIVHALLLALRSAGSVWFLSALSLLAAFALFCAFVINSWDGALNLLGGCFGLVVFASLYASTAWALATYAYFALLMVRSGENGRWQFGLAQLLGSTCWIGAHCGAWRWTYEIMLSDYAQLPTTTPTNCFICSAAANGHARFVQSEACVGAGGAVYRVNDQLRRLKAFELLLLAISPRAHRACRRVYDRCGPPVARLICAPLLADCAYLLLKPLEWMALVILYLVAPSARAPSRVLYRAQPSSKDV